MVILHNIFRVWALRAFFLITIPAFLSPIKAQEKRTTISFEYFAHDFGTIKEDGGTVNYEFNFTNTGNLPLIIKKVDAACGCTVPEWPKEAIAPGEKGVIKVEFNPFNKPGPFNKSLSVHSNASNETVMLNVSGKVTPKPRRPADDYPDLIGNFRMVSRYMNLGDITTEKNVAKSYSIYNQADTVVNIEKLSYNNSFMKVTIEPMALLPRAKATVTVEFDPAKRNDYGYVQDRIELITNDKLQDTKSIYVTSNITKYFPPIRPEDTKSLSIIKLDKTVHDFGDIKQGDKVTAVFTITNIGGDNLIIYKVKPSCGCTLSELEKKVLLPGESGKLTLTFDSAGKDGIQEKHINLYCSDPKNFNPVITIKAKIKK